MKTGIVAVASESVGSTSLILVDEDSHYRDASEVELGNEGFAVCCFNDRESMLTVVADGLRPDAIILNWDSNLTAS